VKPVNPRYKWSPMTMTVGELIAELQKHDPELPVVATWEGTGNGVVAENFDIKDHQGEKQLCIEVDNH